MPVIGYPIASLGHTHMLAEACAQNLKLLLPQKASNLPSEMDTNPSFMDESTLKDGDFPPSKTTIKYLRV